MYEDIVLWAECRAEKLWNDDTQICTLSLSVLQLLCRLDSVHVSVLRPELSGPQKGFETAERVRKRRKSRSRRRS
jgi:hypothetical protein